MNQVVYSAFIQHAKELQKDKKLLWQDGILADKMIGEIAGEELARTVRAHILEAQKLIGVPLLCSLESDKSKHQTFFVFRNLKTNTLLDAKLWHLPQKFADKKYKFLLVWMDSEERMEFDPDWTYPVVITKFN